MIKLGREISTDLESAERKEWLVTNGIGGFAMGTVAGMLTRRYHGLLVAALNPPLGRRLLATKLDEAVIYDGRTYPLYVNRWADGTLNLDGFHRLRGFHLEGTIPVWTFEIADAILEKRIWMQHSENTTYIQYKVTQSSRPLHLSIKVLLNNRDYHGVTDIGDISFDIRPVSDGVRVETSNSEMPSFILGRDMTFEVQNRWYGNYSLSVEGYRGLPDIEAHYYGANASADLGPGDSVTLVASTKQYSELDGVAAFEERNGRDQGLLHRANLSLKKELAFDDGRVPQPIGSAVDQLILAADQFIVRRSTSGDPNGLTVIAGYPWFGDWGRDTMIALPGLTLATGRAEDAAKILSTFAAYVDKGMLPNRFPDEGQEPEYNTADASLWYFEALRSYFDFTGDLDLVRRLFPALREIIDWHVSGTRFNIGLDPEDGLLYAGESGVQLTWMDAKVGDWVVTPRIGKPVEINALWFNALNVMVVFGHLLGENTEEYLELARNSKAGFQRYWNQEREYCFDVLDGPEGDDPALRPNQIFAVSLPYSPLGELQMKQVVDCCTEQLFTPNGLRSLSAEHPEYVGNYGGDVRVRDGAYHQGTAWGWLIGPFISAHLRVHGDLDAALTFLKPLLDHLGDYGIGSISEIFDGDSPFTARGCPAQAWSVAEALRIVRLLK
ncbi:MAG TPA: amylo-alpha-1,6-glucosidase [candidate division Zixibacteria bacterium]|nr:amylo-alpha-1,6-glucosidase [candidate division Zixibacteria bacterium]